LIELLAAIALTSIVLALLGSAHLFAQKQYQNQTTDIDHHREVRLALSSVTQDLRTVTSSDVLYEDNLLTIGENSYQLDESSNEIKANGSTLAKGIEFFEVELCTSSNLCDAEEHIMIKIESIANQQGKKASLSTTIYFRE